MSISRGGDRTRACQRRFSLDRRQQEGACRSAWHSRSKRGRCVSSDLHRRSGQHHSARDRERPQCRSKSSRDLARTRCSSDRRALSVQLAARRDRSPAKSCLIRSSSGGFRPALPLPAVIEGRASPGPPPSSIRDPFVFRKKRQCRSSSLQKSAGLRKGHSAQPQFNPFRPAHEENLKFAVLLACAHASGSKPLVEAAERESNGRLSDAQANAARGAAAVMAMNNVYYRFIHLVKNPKYGKMPARLRMNIIGTHGVAKEEFELMSLGFPR